MNTTTQESVFKQVITAIRKPAPACYCQACGDQLTHQVTWCDICQKGFDLYTSAVYMDYCAERCIDAGDADSHDDFSDNYIDNTKDGICTICGEAAEHDIVWTTTRIAQGDGVYGREEGESQGSKCCAAPMVDCHGDWV